MLLVCGPSTKQSPMITTVHCSYLAVDLVRLCSSAAQQVPLFVLNVANVDVISIVFTKRNAGAAKHQQVVTMKDS